MKAKRAKKKRKEIIQQSHTAYAQAMSKDL